MHNRLNSYKIILINSNEFHQKKSYKPDFRPNGHLSTWLIHPPRIVKQTTQCETEEQNACEPQYGSHQNPTTVLIPWRLQSTQTTKMKNKAFEKTSGLWKQSLGIKKMMKKLEQD